MNLIVSLLLFVQLTLSASLLTQFQTDGFLILPNFMSEQECDELKAAANELVDSFDTGDVKEIFTTVNQSKYLTEYFLKSGENISIFFEKDAFDSEGNLRQPKLKSINKIGHAMHDLHPVFNKFSRNQKLAQLTTELGVQNPLIVQSMYIFKQPSIGGEVTCHQDATFLMTEPDTILGYWFAIEDATIENGCLWAIPGGHLEPLRSKFVRNGLKTSFNILDPSPWDLTPMVPLEVKKGTLIVLHGHTPHMSFANKSLKSRHAYTLHIIDAFSEYLEENWLQRSIEFPFRGF